MQAVPQVRFGVELPLQLASQELVPQVICRSSQIQVPFPQLRSHGPSPHCICKPSQALVPLLQFTLHAKLPVGQTTVAS